MENSDILTGESSSGTLTAEDAEAILDLIADDMTDTDVQALVADTSMEGTVTNSDELIAYINNNGLSDSDAYEISANIEDDPTIVENAIASLSGDLQVEATFSTKLGTLISGFGLGVYGDAYSILDASSMGIDSMILESGIKAGYGFNMGPFGIGVSGDFAIVSEYDDVAITSVTDFSSIMNQSMVYGYAWGIDAGVTYEIFKGLTVGAVMTDIIGTYTDAGTSSLSDLLSGDSGTDIDSDYSFDLDLDVGVSFAPNFGKLFKPTFNVDYYDFIEMFRTPPENFQDVIDHVRVGASVELFTILNLRAQYYQEFFAIGAGVDLFVLEIFGEVEFNQTFDEIGAGVLVKFHI
jgi:hypothetical protein